MFFMQCKRNSPIFSLFLYTSIFIFHPDTFFCYCDKYTGKSPVIFQFVLHFLFIFIYQKILFYSIFLKFGTLHKAPSPSAPSISPSQTETGR